MGWDKTGWDASHSIPIRDGTGSGFKSEILVGMGSGWTACDWDGMESGSELILVTGWDGIDPGKAGLVVSRLFPHSGMFFVISCVIRRIE